MSSNAPNGGDLGARGFRAQAFAAKSMVSSPLLGGGLGLPSVLAATVVVMGLIWVLPLGRSR
ncbi:MAG: hypothetical protein OEO23_01705 [Gemmatimonadota bacterium]|nr:hypothetical protein [Gemmatimonadota bacterium]